MQLDSGGLCIFYNYMRHAHVRVLLLLTTHPDNSAYESQALILVPRRQILGLLGGQARDDRCGTVSNSSSNSFSESSYLGHAWQGGDRKKRRAKV